MKVTRHLTGATLTAIMAVGGLASVGAPSGASANEAVNPVHAALTGGTPTVFLRYRFENVDDDAFDDDASLDSLQTRLGYRTGAVAGVSGYFEFSATRHGMVDDVGPPDYPVVADPEVTRVNQAFLDYDTGLDTQARLGNQRIKLDNDRWVGNVGFRQQEQTYNALRLTSTAVPDLNIDYSYAYRVNRIGPFEPEKGDFHLLNLRYAGLDAVTLTAYGYLLDFDDWVARSSDTFGVRATGRSPLQGDLALLYTAEYAVQSDAGDNPDSYSASYMLADLGVATGPLTVRAAYEVLGSDGGDYAVQTPLATLHAHNGWTDQFLGTPAAGLVDLSLSASFQATDRTRLMAVYRDYSSDEGSIDYGSEIGLLAGYTLPCGATLEAKYAAFSADDGPADGGIRDGDINKLWLTAQKAF